MSKRIARGVYFLPRFREDLAYLIKTDRKVALRTLQLVEAIIGDPFDGIGKPEPQSFELAGCWSRRITQEHRLIYFCTCLTDQIFCPLK